MYNKSFKVKPTKELLEELRAMMIIGQISNAGEADEIKLIIKNFIVGNRMKELAHSLKQ